MPLSQVDKTPAFNFWQKFCKNVYSSVSYSLPVQTFQTFPPWCTFKYGHQRLKKNIHTIVFLKNDSTVPQTVLKGLIFALNLLSNSLPFPANKQGDSCIILWTSYLIFNNHTLLPTCITKDILTIHHRVNFIHTVTIEIPIIIHLNLLPKEIPVSGTLMKPADAWTLYLLKPINDQCRHKKMCRKLEWTGAKEMGTI